MLAKLDLRHHWRTPPHLLLLNDLILRVAAGRLKRLAVSMPPRHGKSSFLSQYVPAWFLGTFPDKRVILCSYEADFAAEWGGKARNILERWGPRFGVSVRADSKAADRWDVAGRAGGMRTAGVGGPITGKGADLLIIDDPVKNAEQALSPTYRQKAWDWYTSTAYTRLEPGAAVVLLQTRWHTGDLMGRVTGDRPADWHVLNLPALARAGDPLGRRPGEALWPGRYDAAALDEIRRTLGPTWYAALYDGEPVDREGGFFKAECFKLIAAPPVDLVRRVRCWDLAGTEARVGADPDYTAGVLMGADKDGRYYVLDVRRERLSPKGVRDLLLQTAQLDGKEVKVWVEQEGGASGKFASEDLVAHLAGYAARVEKPDTSKEVRADPLASQVEAGNVYLVKAGWNRDFIEECRAFPAGGHDDMVDAASYATAKLAAGRAVWVR